MAICTTSLTFNNTAFSPHSVFMCFVWIWEQTAIISLYSINWLVCITGTECVYCAVRTGYLYNSASCPHSVFMCSVWISEQTAIISLYNINWLVCITETECVYCAVRTGSLNIIQVSLSLQNYNAEFSRTLQNLVSQLSQLNPHANTEHFLIFGVSNKLILKIDLLLYIHVPLTATPRYDQRSGLVRIKDEIERQCVPHPTVKNGTLTINGPATGSSLVRIDCIRFWAIRDIQGGPLPCHWAGKFYSVENLHLTDTVLWDTLKGHSIFCEHFWCNIRGRRFTNIL